MLEYTNDDLAEAICCELGYLEGESPNDGFIEDVGILTYFRVLEELRLYSSIVRLIPGFGIIFIDQILVKWRLCKIKSEIIDLKEGSVHLILNECKSIKSINNWATH